MPVTRRNAAPTKAVLAAILVPVLAVLALGALAWYLIKARRRKALQRKTSCEGNVRAPQIELNGRIHALVREQG